MDPLAVTDEEVGNLWDPLPPHAPVSSEVAEYDAGGSDGLHMVVSRTTASLCNWWHFEGNIALHLCQLVSSLC